MTIRQAPSPNFNDRSPDVPVSLVVLHGTAGDIAASESWLRCHASQASAHYLIDRAGAVVQLVDESKRAWHAGVSEWRGQADPRGSVNGFSIGIELVNRGPLSGDATRAAQEPYTPEQYHAAAELCADIVRRRGITFDNIVGHCHVAPVRKTDPWLYFEWGTFFRLLTEALR